MADKKLVIVGAGETADIAYEYFTHDSPYSVVAFSVESPYLKEARRFGLPVLPFETLEQNYAPSKYEVYVAISYTQLNRVRARLFAAAKKKGYRCASYVSSRAFVWRNVEIGENVFIFENNVVQHRAKIGDNVILWSGNHIGHQTAIGNHTYISSHVVISGFCDIGESCFFGVNCSVGDQVRIGKDGVIGMGAVVVKDTEPGKVYVGNPAKPLEKDSYTAFQVQENER